MCTLARTAPRGILPRNQAFQPSSSRIVNFHFYLRRARARRFQSLELFDALGEGCRINRLRDVRVKPVAHPFDVRCVARQNCRHNVSQVGRLAQTFS